jgi:hypothetical protein
MDIRSTMKTLLLDKVMTSLLSEEVRWKYFKSTNKELIIHGRSKEKGEKK